VLILSFDTATDVSTCALVADGEVLGERLSVAQRLLGAIDELCDVARVRPGEIDALAVGLGPGSFTATRVGLAVARGLGFGLGTPAAGVATLDALTAGAPGALPLIDARRGEVFAPGPVVLPPDLVEGIGDAMLVGSGAVRYREELEARGATIPPDDDPRHVPWARHHAALAATFGPAALLEPIYVRAPDIGRIPG
jgi:tRNA threonylcarbamoyl adenosine modification protein YeaZ